MDYRKNERKVRIVFLVNTGDQIKTHINQLLLQKSNKRNMREKKLRKEI